MSVSELLLGGSAALAAIAFVVVVYVRKKGNPFLHERELHWAIGIYTGPSPFQLTPMEGVKNPVLRAEDVTDIEARFVADPFMLRDGDMWYLFVEVLNAQAKKGEIAYATSTDGIAWDYQQIVLDEPFHLSYPYVFTWGGDYYMVPESGRSRGVRLYRADNFPKTWRLAGNILDDVDYVDTSIFRYGDKWWLFTTRSYPNSHSLYLYYSDELLGPWVEHPKSPVVQSDLRITRPAGRVLVNDSGVFRYAQNLDGGYGLDVRAFEVTKLTETEYEERAAREGPVVGRTGQGWNGVGMHHIDAHEIAPGKWFAVVDGRGRKRMYGPVRRPWYQSTVIRDN